jgi:rhamnogalacturonan endolyase
MNARTTVLATLLLAPVLSSPTARPAENLDRGLVALRRADDGNFLSWRLLASDPKEIAFHVDRAAAAEGPWQSLTPEPLAAGCNFQDAAAGTSPWFYRVQTAGHETTSPASQPVQVANSPGFVSLKLKGDYRPQKVGLADFDGDGRLDYLIKQPDFNTDPYQRPGYWKRSEDTYKLEAYRHDGTFLWRYDMGWAIEEGIWYSPIVAYDVDGDGRAEVYCKAGEGDPREPTGHVMSGPEYLVKLDGLTGKVVAKRPWPSRDGIDNYNYYSRNLLGIAWLDGKRPHLIVQRGTYTLIKVQAYDPDLHEVWRWDSSMEERKYASQGMHGMHAADLDEDGRDELILGSCVLDDDGHGLWTREVGHPDTCYVADIVPSLPGLEIFFGIEPRQKSNAVCVVEGRTGRLLWGNPEPTVHVHSQGMLGDIIPEEPGLECYAGEAKGGTNYWLYTASGKRVLKESLGELSPKAIYWQGGATKSFVLKNRILDWPDKEIGRIEGRIVAIADCLGDWREEIITAFNGEVRIYSSTIPTPHRRVCLMQDRLYRNDVAVQTMGYFYPPQLGTPLRLR